MYANTLVFFCVAIGLTAGTCTDQDSQKTAQYFAVATQVEAPRKTVEIVSSGSVSGNAFAQFLTAAPSVPANTYSEVISSGPSFSAQPTNGPEASALPVIQAPPVTLPAVQGPIITVSSQPIPPIKVLAQRCLCTKTIVKPQVIQRQVTVPKYKRYLRRTVTPVVENVSYKSTPITQGTPSTADIVIPGSAPVAAPAVATPVVAAPVVAAPAVAAPVVEAPVFSAPVYSSPVFSAPVATAPATSSCAVLSSDASFRRYF